MGSRPAAGGGVEELLCVRGGWDGLRARRLPDGPDVIVRTGISKVLPVAGEIFTIAVEKSWIFGNTQYLSGRVRSAWLDPSRWTLQPLRVHRWPNTESSEEDADDLPDEITAAIRELGPRKVCEMEQVQPRLDGRADEDDSVLEAVELAEIGHGEEATQLLSELLVADLRCLDAHAHLGVLELRSAIPGAVERGHRHYQVGVAIGDLTVGDDFRGLLPWGLIDNRPYLRCLHGLGISAWRSGDFTGALEAFRRLLLFNPNDNQGVRLIWHEVRGGLAWKPLQRRR